MYDIIIVGAGASGLFLGCLLPREKKVMFLEKNEKIGNKLLLSGKGRCNFTNLNVGRSHYYGDNLEKLDNLFKIFGSQEIINYLNKNGIQTKEEDQGRMFLKSNKSKELLGYFFQENKRKGREFFTNQEVIKIEKTDKAYKIHTKNQSFFTKKVVIATGGKTFPQIGSSDFIFQFAKQFGIKTHSPTPALCGIVVKENLSSLSGSSVLANIQVISRGSKIIYQKNGKILFTHWGVSGPSIFNLSLFLGDYVDHFHDLKIKFIIDEKEATKRLISYLNVPKGLKKYILTVSPAQLKDREDAKVMLGGILFDELTEDFELKKNPGIFVLGECINITGETGGYNLQWCWTSAYFCAKALS